MSNVLNLFQISHSPVQWLDIRGPVLWQTSPKPRCMQKTPRHTVCSEKKKMLNFEGQTCDPYKCTTKRANYKYDGVSQQEIVNGPLRIKLKFLL